MKTFQVLLISLIICLSLWAIAIIKKKDAEILRNYSQGGSSGQSHTDVLERKIMDLDKQIRDYKQQIKENREILEQLQKILNRSSNSGDMLLQDVINKQLPELMAKVKETIKYNNEAAQSVAQFKWRIEKVDVRVQENQKILEDLKKSNQIQAKTVEDLKELKEDFDDLMEKIEKSTTSGKIKIEHTDDLGDVNKKLEKLSDDLKKVQALLNE